MMAGILLADVVLSALKWLAISVGCLYVAVVYIGTIYGSFTNFGLDNLDWDEMLTCDESQPSWDDPYVDELMLACAAESHRIGCCHPDCLNGPEDPDWRRKRFFGEDS